MQESKGDPYDDECDSEKEERPKKSKAKRTWTESRRIFSDEDSAVSDEGAVETQRLEKKKSNARALKPEESTEKKALSWRLQGFRLCFDRHAYKAVIHGPVDNFTILQQPEFHGIASVDLAVNMVCC